MALRSSAREMDANLAGGARFVVPDGDGLSLRRLNDESLADDRRCADVDGGLRRDTSDNHGESEFHDRADGDDGHLFEHGHGESRAGANGCNRKRAAQVIRQGYGSRRARSPHPHRGEIDGVGGKGHRGAAGSRQTHRLRTGNGAIVERQRSHS